MTLSGAESQAIWTTSERFFRISLHGRWLTRLMRFMRHVVLVTSSTTTT